MANERTYPCLPCAELDPAIAFYEALGFSRQYRQLRPNPYAVVQREDFQVHLFGIDGFDPEQSYGTTIVAVPDPDALYQSFAQGLRATYGKLPVKGIPRITRPRKRFGTVYGFSVVDLGGNWLRVSGQKGESHGADPDATEDATGLARALAAAARLGDAHGDDTKALRTLESGLQKYPDESPIVRARALLYRAELAVRLGNAELARASVSEAQSLPLSAEQRAELTADLDHALELLQEQPGS